MSESCLDTRKLTCDIERVQRGQSARRSAPFLQLVRVGDVEALGGVREVAAARQRQKRLRSFFVVCNSQGPPAVHLRVGWPLPWHVEPAPRAQHFGRDKPFFSEKRTAVTMNVFCWCNASLGLRAGGGQLRAQLVCPSCLAATYALGSHWARASASPCGSIRHGYQARLLSVRLLCGFLYAKVQVARTRVVPPQLTAEPEA